MVIERLLSQLKGKNNVIEGLRDPKQVKELEKKTGKRPVIIAIKSNFEFRLKRELTKKRFHDMTRKDLKKRDIAELKLGEGELIKRADYVIDNTNLTKEELKEKINKILQGIHRDFGTNI